MFSPYDVLQPDIVYFRPERAHLVDLDRPISERPDLRVEVLSASTRETDRGRKMQMFARYHVPEYWIVDPGESSIEIFRLHEDAFVLAGIVSADAEVTSPLLPGLTFAARSVFPPA